MFAVVACDKMNLGEGSFCRIENSCAETGGKTGGKTRRQER